MIHLPTWVPVVQPFSPARRLRCLLSWASGGSLGILDLGNRARVRFWCRGGSWGVGRAHELGRSGWFGQDKLGHGVVVLGSIITSHSTTNKCISSGGELSLRCYCSAAPWRPVILCILQCLGLMSTKCEFLQSRRVLPTPICYSRCAFENGVSVAHTSEALGSL